MTSTRRSGAAFLLRPVIPALLVAGAVACGAGAGPGAGEPPSPRAAGTAVDTAEMLPTEATPREAVPTPTEGEIPTAVGRRAPGGVLLDTVRAGRFDDGRMWTFEYPPIDYLAEAYGFRPDTSWFRSARLGALRIPGCSASFVSAHGLVMTNHHCARESVTGVSEDGESLLDEGFYARSVEEERPVEEFHADRLIEIRDITDPVYARLEAASEGERAERRQAVLDSIRAAILDEFGGEDGGYAVETISLYNGGRYSAYVFRRYEDVRLVMAPELQIGFFGGDPDNFTYPRYNLDVSFYRVYGEDGEPLDPGTHFSWSTDGVSPGDVVFVIGNPGSTSRLQTVAELEFRRDVSDQKLLEFLRSRIRVLEAFHEDHPEISEEIDLRNTIFSLSNSEKAYSGMVRGLNDPVIMTRRRDRQRAFQDSIRSDPALSSQYGGLVERMAELQARKREVAPAYGAFLAMTSEDFASATLRRALFAQQLLDARERGVPEQALEGVIDQILAVGSQPAELDEGLMADRFRDVVRNYGEDSEVARSLLQGRTPEGLAAVIRESSVLADSAEAGAAVRNASLGRSDPAVRAAGAYFPTFIEFQRTLQEVSPQEDEVAADLGRARFEVYGTSVPPDATFSLRIADGVVEPYEYNGTRAPVHTTFYGLYDHYHSYRGDDAWALPERWRTVPEGFDLSTPLNFVSTADIIGGNSGSPVINRNLEVVGLIFDGNIESLPGDYIYMPEISRAVAVDVRGILEALDDVYDMDRIVLELTDGRLAPTEAEADRMRAAGSR